MISKAVCLLVCQVGIWNLPLDSNVNKQDSILSFSLFEMNVLLGRECTSAIT